MATQETPANCGSSGRAVASDPGVEGYQSRLGEPLGPALASLDGSLQEPEGPRTAAHCLSYPPTRLTRVCQPALFDADTER